MSLYSDGAKLRGDVAPAAPAAAERLALRRPSIMPARRPQADRAAAWSDVDSRCQRSRIASSPLAHRRNGPFASSVGDADSPLDVPAFLRRQEV